MSSVREERAAGARGDGGEAGYNLVILMVLITLLNIAVAMAMPLWSTAMRRDREEELIFRGLQYAEAIRVFEQRQGRLPVRLEELLEVEPRSIRRLWEDPITGSRRWGVLFASGPQGDLPGEPPTGTSGLPAPAAPAGEPNGGGEGAGAASGQTLTRGPIRGVYSRSRDEAIKTFLGRQRYHQWHFTIELVANAQASPHVQGVNWSPRMGAQWIGRPFRPGLGPVQPGAPPPGTPPPGTPLQPSAGRRSG
ncbi:MAG TPA: type II secretion system protein [Thermoanaerobaculia bacterium]|nr:type II secretion system protein [Thermoanaerobaculia bacterium]